MLFYRMHCKFLHAEHFRLTAENIYRFSVGGESKWTIIQILTHKKQSTFGWCDKCTFTKWSISSSVCVCVCFQSAIHVFSSCFSITPPFVHSNTVTDSAHLCFSIDQPKLVQTTRNGAFSASFDTFSCTFTVSLYCYFVWWWWNILFDVKMKKIFQNRKTFPNKRWIVDDKCTYSLNGLWRFCVDDDNDDDDDRTQLNQYCFYQN